MSLPSQTFELACLSENLPPFREKLRALLAASGLAEKPSGETVLAVDEALSNVVRHSYEGKGGKMRVDFRDFDDRVEIVISDWGKKFDPEKVPAPQIPPTKPGGLGVFFIKKLMDKADWDAKCEGNRLTLVKYKG